MIGTKLKKSRRITLRSILFPPMNTSNPIDPAADEPIQPGVTEASLAPYLLTPESLTKELDLQAIFPTDQPLEVELGCGSGRFVSTRAEKHPHINYLAVERMKGRAFSTAGKFQKRELSNARLLRLEASYVVNYLLPPSSVDALYVFFPDPWPKRRHHTRRLFNDEFLTSLCRTMKLNGRVYLNTDHEDYFKVIHALFEQHPAFDPIEPVIPSEDERTGFEMVFMNQGLDIHRIGYALTRKPDARTEPA